jgi:hypothetical protein
MIYPLVTEFIPDWRLICIFVISCPLLFSLLLVNYCFCESPRYLVSIKKFDRAKEVFRVISVFNRRPSFKFNLFQEMEIFNKKVTKIRSTNNLRDVQSINIAKKKTQRGSNFGNFTDLFRNP